MLTDEAKIKVKAGDGGDGIVTFDKVKMSLGPTGGRGGNGGNVYLVGVADIFALNRYRHQKEHYAPDGNKGRGNRSDGPAGKDLFLNVPIGTVVTNLNTNRKYDVVEPGDKILIAQGGIGGRGNFYFRSGSNTSPLEYEKGKKGEEFELSFELRLIADAGLIGLPSAGKTSILNELTAANAKVGAYHFTTLEPNLGVMDRVIIADIPGLIEGASTGRGLGIKFLRHIRRTKALIHCIASDSEDVIRDYLIIRKELADYDPGLKLKKELVLLTKSDLLEKKAMTKLKKELKDKLKIDAKNILTVSIHDLDAITKLGAKIKQFVA